MTVPIQASIVTGFESVGRREVEHLLGVKCTSHRGSLRFSLEQERILETFKLRSVDNLYAVLYEYTVDGLNGAGEQEALDLIRGEVPKINWAKAVEWWQMARGRTLAGDVDLVKDQMRAFIESGTVHPVGEQSPTFRVTCKRAGAKEAHSFTSMDAAKVFGAQLNNIFGWKPDMKNFDIEIALNIAKDEVLVMIALNEETMFKRNMVSFGPTTMRSTICYCMVALADPKPGDKLLDPMCGGGSIPIEGALAFPGVSFTGGDIHPMAIERCRENCEFNSAKVAPSTVEFTHMDATSLPFDDDAFAALVTDMPFGKKIGSITDNRRTYPKLLKEWQRVVSSGGKAVLLTKDKRTIETILRGGETAWQMCSSHMVNVGGLSVLCAVLINRK